jgi:hypothetical protein
MVFAFPLNYRSSADRQPPIEELGFFGCSLKLTVGPPWIGEARAANPRPTAIVAALSSPAVSGAYRG